VPLLRVTLRLSLKVRRELAGNLRVGVLHLCSIRELNGALRENRRILYRQNEVQETLLSLFPIYRRLPKLDVNPAVGVWRIRNEKRPWLRESAQEGERITPGKLGPGVTRTTTEGTAVER
jgi:hypothetical protein